MFYSDNPKESNLSDINNTSSKWFNETNFNSRSSAYLPVKNQSMNMTYNEAGDTSNGGGLSSFVRFYSKQADYDVSRDSSATNAQASFFNVNPNNSTFNNLTNITKSFNVSELEQTIINSEEPVNLNETEEITVLGQRGIWANKQEVVNWQGMIPISEYKINEDPNPELIRKKTNQILEYVQESAIRYLRPPTPPSPGDIIINQEPDILTSPAPPLIIRQQPFRPSTPEPLVIREAPPQPPAQTTKKIITISGKNLPPPPRKVVIERLAPLPKKPQSVILERWLAYPKLKRKVIYQKQQAHNDPVVINPKNVVIQWETPKAVIKKEFKYLGILKANPNEYVKRYGETLKQSKELPDFVLEIKPPEGVVLAADYEKLNQLKPKVYELEGDVDALRLVNLEQEGLGEYRSQLNMLNYSSNKENEWNQQSTTNQSTVSNLFDLNLNKSNERNYLLRMISNAFLEQNKQNNKVNMLSLEESEKLLFKLNSRLGRNYGEDDVKKFIQLLDTDRDGFISFDEFKIAFEATLL